MSNRNSDVISKEILGFLGYNPSHSLEKHFSSFSRQTMTTLERPVPDTKLN